MKPKKTVIVGSFIVQFFIALGSIGIIFLDSAPNFGELALLLGLIFFVHALVISFSRKDIKKSYASIIFGYALVAIILSFQDEFSDWFVTGVGGIGLVDAVIAVVWPAVISLWTIILIKKKRKLKFKESIKKFLTYLIPAWILLIFIVIARHPFLLEPHQPIIDVLSLFEYLISLIPTPVFMLVFGIESIIASALVFTFLTVHLFTKAKNLEKILLGILTVMAIVLFAVSQPWSELKLKPQFLIWNYNSAKLYSFELSGLELSAPCPIEPVITDRYFDCADGLLHLQIENDAGFSYALAKEGESISYWEEPQTTILKLPPFNDIGIYKEEDCRYARPLVAYENLHLAITVQACGIENYNEFGGLMVPLLERIEFPAGGFVSEY